MDESAHGWPLPAQSELQHCWQGGRLHGWLRSTSSCAAMTVTLAQMLVRVASTAWRLQAGCF
eukprot:1137543-Pelagomonas_calceolata.AAC.1